MAGQSSTGYSRRAQSNYPSGERSVAERVRSDRVKLPALREAAYCRIGRRGSGLVHWQALPRMARRVCLEGRWMTNLRDVLQPHIGNGTVPGMVGLVAPGDQVEVQALGSTDLEGTQPMARETIFRVASLTKPITAAATMMLVEDGLIRLDDTVDRWLPEIAHPTVVRTLQSSLDDVVPAARPITVADLLTFRAGYGFPSDVPCPWCRRSSRARSCGGAIPRHCQRQTSG